MKKSTSAGFSLMELLVVISVIGIITSTVVFQHRGASEGLALDTAANTLVLEIRKAQAYGLGVREFDRFDGVSDSYAAGYGVYVESDPGSSTEVTFFADHPQAGIQKVYDESDDIEITSVTLQGDVFIVNIEDESGNTSGSGSVVYTRPEPNADLYVDGRFVDEIYITLQSSQNEDKERVVVVNKEGQVSVQK
jgi:prepilin-type N-terminal cleavage/methylation domain-containing protein